MTASPHLPKHPASEGKAAWFHGALVLWYVLGLWFHAVSAWRHFKDWLAGRIGKEPS